MSLVTLLLTALGLAADAFAVSVAKGMRMRHLILKPALLIAVTFGAFQGLMPVIGWALGSRLTGLIQPWDHWIAFALLAAIGAKMIWEARGDEVPGDSHADADADGEGGESPAPADTSADAGTANALPAPVAVPVFTIRKRELLILGVATSIDALAVGVSLAFLEAGIVQAALVIAAVTFAMSMVGIRLGHHAGKWLARGAELAGGVVLIGIGVKILVDHLG